MCRRIFKEQTSEVGDIPFYKIGTFGAEPDAFIPRGLFEEYKSKYPYPQKGDILISASGSIGRTVVFTGNNEYFQDSNIVWLKHDERLSNQFLKCFYSVVKWDGIEGSTIKRLYNDNILNTVICMPSVPEQEFIGVFFENLDYLITLHQQKYEKFLDLKKAMLYKLFPKEGETTPEIRFDGFSGEWEKRKLGELGEIITGSTPPTSIKNNYSNDGLMWVTPTDIKGSVTIDSERKLSVEGKKTARIVPKDTILVTCIASIGKNTILGREGSFNQQINCIIPYRGKYHPYFLLTESVLWSNYMKKNAGLSAMQIVNRSEFSKIITLTPSYEEQKAIGEYFSKLDQLIELNKEKLEKLKNIKSLLLDKMFV